jgi:hypothetical protein
MPSSGMLRRVALVRTDVSEELSASIIRVTRIGELRTLALTSNRRALVLILVFWTGTLSTQFVGTCNQHPEQMRPCTEATANGDWQFP